MGIGKEEVMLFALEREVSRETEGQMHPTQGEEPGAVTLLLN